MTATLTKSKKSVGSIKCGACKDTHPSIGAVRACYQAKGHQRQQANQEVHVPQQRQSDEDNFPATPGQTGYVRFLINDRDMEQHLVVKATGMLNRGLTFQEASRIIDYAKPLPRKGHRPHKPAVDEGMYRMDGDIYRVQVAVNGSGYLYAKVLIPPTEMGGKPRFRRAPSALYKLQPEHRMTKEDAAEFGALYGFCVVCGRTLTDEVSIEKGIGPICESKV